MTGKLPLNKSEKKNVKRDYSKQIFRKSQPDTSQKKWKKLLSLTMKMSCSIRTLPSTMLISICIAFKITSTNLSRLQIFLKFLQQRTKDLLVKNENFVEKMISVLLKLRDLILSWWMFPAKVVTLWAQDYDDPKTVRRINVLISKLMVWSLHFYT